MMYMTKRLRNAVIQYSIFKFEISIVSLKRRILQRHYNSEIIAGSRSLIKKIFDIK